MILYDNMDLRLPSALEVSTYTIKVGQKISREMEKELVGQVSLSGWLVLDYLLRNGESPLSELVAFMGSKANTTEVTKTLVRQGLITKEVISNDRRAKYVRITPLGSMVAEQNEPRLGDMSAVLLGELDDAGLSQVGTAMSTILGKKVTALLDRSGSRFLTS